MIRRLSLFAALTTALLWAGSACAQVKALIFPPSYDVTKQVGLVQEYNTGYENNRSDLQTWLDATQFRQYPLYWPGGYADKKHILFDRTITIPATAGLRWVGMGLQDPEGYSASDAGTILCNRAISNGTNFDGTTNKLTATGAGTTCVVTGRATVAEDLYNSVHITGGTNVNDGWYGITAVTPGASGSGTWTLAGIGNPTGNWCSGAVTAGTGYYCPAIIANKSYGIVVDGLAFTSRVLNADADSALVLWHNLTSTQAGVQPGGHQSVLTNCSFGYSQVGILDGVDLAGAYEDGAATEWVGRTQIHADTHITENLIFSNVKTCRYRRNQNGVWGYDRTWRVANLDGDIFRFDCGGKHCADTLWISGTGTGTRQNVLYLGPGVETNMNPFIVRNVSFDHSTEHPQLVVTDFSRANGTNSGIVVFDGVVLDANSSDPTDLDDFPLIDIDGAGCYTFRYVVGANTGVNGIWENAVTLDADALGNKPIVVFVGCMLDVTDPEDVINETATPAGITVKFENCYDSNFALFDGGATTTYTTQ